MPARQYLFDCRWQTRVRARHVLHERQDGEKQKAEARDCPMSFSHKHARVSRRRSAATPRQTTGANDSRILG
jgi:hypothetical protein